MSVTIRFQSLALLNGLRIQRCCCSSHSAPSLGPSICHKCGCKKKRKKKASYYKFNICNRHSAYSVLLFLFQLVLVSCVFKKFSQFIEVVELFP